jgi:hypothetical protein
MVDTPSFGDDILMSSDYEGLVTLSGAIAPIAAVLTTPGSSLVCHDTPSTHDTRNDAAPTVASIRVAMGTHQ